MGWRGALRTVVAAQRRVERANEKRRRELGKQLKELQKAEAALLAAVEVEYHQSLIDDLKSVHKTFSQPWNWNGIKATAPPVEPKPMNSNERAARRELDQYSPNFFVKLIGMDKTTRAKLESEVEDAKKKDQEQYKTASKQYHEDLNDWLRLQQIADGILAGNTEVFMEALNETGPFADLTEIGSKIEYRVPTPWLVETRIQVNSNQSIPSTIKSLLKSGKVSEKAMSATQFNELYQDHVCSCVLRVAYEMFALLPINIVLIHTYGEFLNPQTGHKEQRAVLSVAIDKARLYMLNPETIDCSEAMKNFSHNMKFTKSAGFLPIEEINPATLPG